jgi:uncharacterized damage-inducible protein DinB
MTYAESLLPEFDQEMGNTRKVLERVPEDKIEWRPHPKSNTIGWNANHIADLPHWGEAIVTQPNFDFAPAGGKRYETPKLRSRKEILENFDRNVANLRKAISQVKDEDVHKMWSLLRTGQPIFTLPRSVVLRNFVLSHIIHHRAILCVYLRLNDIPVPGMYGPSGEE